MHEYSLNFLPQNETAEDYHFEARDDDEAKSVARRYLDGKKVQIWRVARILEQFELAP